METKSSAGTAGSGQPRHQHQPTQSRSDADSVSNWRRPGVPAAASVAAPQQQQSDKAWRSGGAGGSGPVGGRRSGRGGGGGGGGGTRRFAQANGDIGGGGGMVSAASLDTFDLQRLDQRVQKLVLLLSSPPDREHAPKSVRSLWSANCRDALTELQVVADQGPESELAQRVLSPDAVAILLQLLPQKQLQSLPAEELQAASSSLSLHALLAGTLIAHKITPAEQLTLSTVRHLLSLLSDGPSQQLHDVPNLQLLTALCLNVSQLGQSQGLLRDTIRRLMELLATWPEGGDACPASLCQFYAAQALANLAYLRPTEQPQRDCLPPDLVSALMTRCLVLLESAGEGASSRVLQLVLHLLTFLISRSPPIRPSDLPRLLNQLRRFLCHGLSLQLDRPSAYFGREPELDQLDSVTVPGLRSKKPLKKARWVARGDGGESDEEASLEQRLSGVELRDSDLAELMPRDDRQPSALADQSSRPADSLAEAKVRFISSSCLRRLAESLHKRALQCHWLAFFPDGQPSFLLSLLLREPNSRVRSNLLDLLASLFHGSKTFLLLAEDFGVPKTAFTPLSSRLAGSLRELHKQTLQALLAERSQATQAQLLRCIGQLACNVPYQKLRPGLVTKIFKVASPFLQSESQDVKAACLQCLGQFASLEGPAFEVSHCLLQDCLRSPAASPMLTGFHTPLLGPQTAPFESSWLVQHCLRVAHPLGDGWQAAAESPAAPVASLATPPADYQQMHAQLESTPVRVEALTALRWLVLRYWNFVSPVTQRLRHTLQLCLLPEANRAVRAAAIRALDALLTSLPAEDAAQGVWPTFLPPLLTCLHPSAHYSVRSAAAECLAQLNEASSASLPAEQLGLACQALLGLCQDSLNTVRAAAVRTLGAWTALGAVRFEPAGRRLPALVWQFVELCAANESLVVRAQAAWSLAQSSEALLALPARGPLGPEDLVRLFLTGMNLCADAPKVRESAARLLGNLFCLATASSSTSGHLRACMEQAATGLANLVTPGGSDSANARVRWNASLAIRCAFGRLPVGEPWTLCLHSALFVALRSDKYFKVKIHAACALLALQHRSQFGDRVVEDPAAAATTFGDDSTSEWRRAAPRQQQQRQMVNPMACLVSSVIGCARHVRCMDIPFSEQTHKTVLDYLLCLLLLRACALLQLPDAEVLTSTLSAEAAAVPPESGEEFSDGGPLPTELLADLLGRLWSAHASLAWDNGAPVRQAFCLGSGTEATTSSNSGSSIQLLEPDFAARALDAAEINVTAIAKAAAASSPASVCSARLLELLAGARAEQALHASSLTSAFRQTYD